MKKLSCCLIFVLLAIFSSSESFAQNPIPSFNVEVTAGVTFEEGEPISFMPSLMIMEEKKMKVVVDNTDVFTLEWAQVQYYALDGSFTSDVLYVDENTPLVIIVDSKDYGVRVIDAEQGCEMSVWTSGTSPI